IWRSRSSCTCPPARRCPNSRRVWWCREARGSAPPLAAPRVSAAARGPPLGLGEPGERASGVGAPPPGDQRLHSADHLPAIGHLGTLSRADDDLTLVLAVRRCGG